MRDKPYHEDFHSALVLAIGLLAIVLGERIYPAVKFWLVPTRHRLAAGILGLLALSLLVVRGLEFVTRRIKRKKEESVVFGPGEDAVFSGSSAVGEKVYIKPFQRVMHTQIVGTTNAGKTESIILPWAIQDIQQGRGLILIDGKADRSLLTKLYAYVERAGRADKFRLFSLSNIAQSHQFNPLIGGEPEQIAERVFNSFEFENPYYRSVQFEIFSQFLRLFAQARIVPTFKRLHTAIGEPDRLQNCLSGCDQSLRAWLDEFSRLERTERLKRTSGLTAALSQFAFGKTSVLYNSETPAINLEAALGDGEIIYFQLPVLLAPFLGKATGKLLLQALQSAVASRHRSSTKPKFFSVFLDDFTEYLYPGFVSILNKTRSANIGVVFAHQALGDIKTLGEPVANSILTNSNLKIFMRGSDPESAEYFARVIGTKQGVKFTERTRRGVIGRDYTGDSSAREVEEFVYHPNRFKSSLGIGEAVVVVPHARGSKVAQVKFQMFEDLPAKEIFPVLKTQCPDLAKPEISESKGDPDETYSDR